MSAKTSFKRKALACVLIVTQELAPMAPALAAPPTGSLDLADEPLFTTTTVKPNVMFTLDNSGSMDWQFAPMYVNGEQNRNCFTSSQYNKLFYDPTQTYLPPVLHDGSRMPNASFSGAWVDGYRTPDGNLNLNNGVRAPRSWSSSGGSMGDLSGGSAAHYMVYSGAGTPDPSICYADGSYTTVWMNTQSAAAQQNYANWFSYYRTRLLAMKTSAGEAFRVVDSEYRVGLHTINNPHRGVGFQDGSFIPVDTFSGNHRQQWYNSFYNQQTAGGTPLRAALERVGEYFRVGAAPVNNIPDPIQFSCQQNYHILSTDGQWNGASAVGASKTNVDGTVIPNRADLVSALRM